MNLLAAYQTEFENTMENIFDSFARNVTVKFYQTPTTSLASFDNSYNADFPDFESSVEHTEQSATFPCRLWYLDRQDSSVFIEGGEDLGVKGKFYYNRVRLQCKADAFAYLQNTERFSFEGEIYQIETGWERIGAGQNFQVYQVILQRVN